MAVIYTLISPQPGEKLRAQWFYVESGWVCLVMINDISQNHAITITLDPEQLKGVISLLQKAYEQYEKELKNYKPRLGDVDDAQDDVN